MLVKQKPRTRTQTCDLVVLKRWPFLLYTQRDVDDAVAVIRAHLVRSSIRKSFSQQTASQDATPS